MDKKFKRYKVDYAAAYRHYVDFGGGRTLENFCQDEGYDFEKFKVDFSDGLSLSMSNVSVERMVDLLQSVGK